MDSNKKSNIYEYFERDGSGYPPLDKVINNFMKNYECRSIVESNVCNLQKGQYDVDIKSFSFDLKAQDIQEIIKLFENDEYMIKNKSNHSCCRRCQKFKVTTDLEYPFDNYFDIRYIICGECEILWAFLISNYDSL